MDLLVDLFGYLEIILHGLVILGQSIAVGGVLFLVFLGRPLAQALPAGTTLLRRTAIIAGWGAVGLLVGEALTIGLQGAVLVDTVGLTWMDVMGAGFAKASLVKCAAALPAGTGADGVAIGARRAAAGDCRHRAGGGDADHACGGTDG